MCAFLMCAFLPFANIFDAILDRIPEGRIIFDVLLYLLNGIDDGGIMTVAEFFTDILHRKGSQFAHDVDRDLARLVDIGAA